MMLPAEGWMYWNGEGIAATILLVLIISCMMNDNFLRPALNLSA